MTVYDACTTSSGNGIRYESNNTYLMVGSDGLDPIFGYLNDILVVGGDIMAIFSLALCKVSYFDSHYHSYVVLVTQQRSFLNYLIIMCIMDIPLVID